MTETEFKFKFTLAINQFKLKFKQTPTNAVISWSILKVILDKKRKENNQKGDLIYLGVKLTHYGNTSECITELYNRKHILNFRKNYD